MYGNNEKQYLVRIYGRFDNNATKKTCGHVKYKDTTNENVKEIDDIKELNYL